MSGRVFLLELASVLAILGSVAAIAVPKSAELGRRSQARQIVADVESVRSAVYAFYSDSAYFPAESAEPIPETLVRYLPLTFRSTRPYGSLTYRNWPVAPIYRDSSAANIVGLTVVPRDPRVGESAMALVPRLPKFTVGNRYTFIYFGK